MIETLERTPQRLRDFDIALEQDEENLALVIRRPRGNGLAVPLPRRHDEEIIPGRDETKSAYLELGHVVADIGEERWTNRLTRPRRARPFRAAQ